ncbi:drug resistance transporter, EmrB/QacA subfamily [Paramicrobacterium humi]|uniref:Drug resistance transporter, EmrB/QacA subfamily n=1 Tax=Paramicrobacterium humi TaxID=640635 RepID=A0A1H4IV28_9MICO|nr:MFS transporter [Microbacterium humi]SEB37476.1 drug resistance transporter, EmrB/QacA subfamily [Microbacterium humi]
MQRSQTLNRPLALLVAATFFMENLDGTIIQTAAPAMAADLGVRAVDINLAMTAYLLTLAVGVPVSGWLADRFGTKRVFCTAIGVFTLASLLCALSPSLPLLVAARVLQGAGGAMMVPVGRLAVLRAVDKRDLLDAMAYLTWPALLAPVLAPALGGIISDTIGWHWIFLINIPIGAVALIAGVRLVPAQDAEPRHPLDVLGFALVGVALAAIVLGMEEVGQNVALALGMLGLGLVVGALGIWRMLRAAHPLLRFDALRLPTFRVGNVGGGVYRMLISAAPFVFTLMFQEGFGWSASLAGLLVVAVFVGNVVIKPATSPLIRRFGFRAVIVGSNLAGAAVYVGCAFLTAETPLFVIAFALFASGVFRSIGFSGYNSVQFADVEPADTNAANTLASTMQQVAAGLGIAVAALLVRLSTDVAALVNPADAGLGFRWTFLVVAALLLFPAIEAARLPAQAGSHVARR